MKETLNVILSMSMKSGKINDIEDVKNFADIKGKNLTLDQAMMVCLVQRALKGDLSAIAMVRDTVGEKPAEKVEATVTKNPYDELTADELRELIAKGDVGDK